LAKARKAKSMSQHAFAGAVGTSTQWVSRVERGEENLTVSTLAKLADAVGLSVEDLFAQ